VPTETTLSGEEAANDLSRPYWDALREGKLLLQQCSSCGEWQHYPRFLCRHCRSSELRWARSAGHGIVVARTVAHRTTNPALQERLPLTLALIRMVEGPAVLALTDTALATGDPARFDPQATGTVGLLVFAPTEAR
jgi:uncharacterized OB-fold protein